MTITLPTAPDSLDPDAADLAAAGSLQRLLPPLIALTLEAKQAHWNVTGPAFLPLHEFTDDLADEARAWTDRIAERAVALGSPVDGRPATVAEGTSDPLPAGRLADHQVITELARRISEVALEVRSSIDVLEDDDAVAHDIAIEVLEGLEKFRWMLVASTS